jgi:TonB family protein
VGVEGAKPPAFVAAQTRKDVKHIPCPTIVPDTPMRLSAGMGKRPDFSLLISVLLHALVVALLIFLHRIGEAGPPAPEQPGFEIVFQGGEKSPEAAPVPTAQNLPQVNLVPEDYNEPPPPPPQAAPVPQTEASPVPRPRPRPHPVPNSNPFAHMQVYDFGEGTARSVQRGVRGSHGLSLALGMTVRGGQLIDAVPHITAPGANGEYLDALSDYVESHKFYPEDAAQNGEQGTAVIKATIARDGTVKDVKLVESSGSQTLDWAWLGLFRGKRLPPFPDNMNDKQLELTMSMDYELIYRR